MPRKEIGTAWNRDSRNSMNENFKELYDYQHRSINEATQKTIEASKLVWQEPVATYNNIASTYPNPEVGFTVMARDTGKVYRYDVEKFWKEIHDIDPTAINEVDTRLTAQLAQTELKKADKAEVQSSLNLKRDKSSLIGVNDLDGETLGYLQNGAGGAEINIESVPKDHTVTPKKTTFIYESSNILNLEGGLERTTINPNTGELVSPTDLYLTDYIYVEGSHVSYYGIERVSAFDENKQYIASVGSGNPGAEETRQLPSGTVYIRPSINNDYLDVAHLNMGQELLEYEPYAPPQLEGVTAKIIKKGILEPSHFQNIYADKLERLFDSVPMPEPPHLSNVKIVKGVPITFVHWFHDGLFYGSISRTIYTSPDGENWTALHTLPTDDTASPIAFVIVSDTNRIVVGCSQGQVFVSDENGTFKDTPDFVAGGTFASQFGQLKYKNIIGFTTYVTPQGVDQGQQHEAYLSTNGGASFTKIFDTSTFDTIDGFTDKSTVHLHDIEYDPYSGRIYIWCGDLTSRTMIYSDDWGSKWKMAFPQGQANNATVVIATKDGIALGADTGGGGVGYVHIDRSKKINPKITLENYEGDFWQFAEPDERFIATREWVDRDNGIFLIPYIVEYDDNNERSAYLAYSSDGYIWHNIFKSPNKGHYSGWYTITYGNGLLVGTYRNQVDTGYQVFIAKVDLM